MGWDGNFKKSRYTETGNIVNDVIENDGRILHEPTVDGYTHEMVDRGAYISDDYYFPRKEPGKKPHIHYEIRSNGEVLIDGKSIVKTKKGGIQTMRHGRQLSRNRSLDGTILKKESDDKVQEGKRISELGKKFESDKAKLEAEIEKVRDSKISNPDKKKALIDELESAIRKLQEQYERDVAEEEKRVHEELSDKIEDMQEASDALEQQANDLRNLEMEASSTDASAAADEADAQRQQFEQMKAEYVAKLNLQMEQAEIQRRNIRNRRMSGQ